MLCIALMRRSAAGVLCLVAILALLALLVLWFCLAPFRITIHYTVAAVNNGSAAADRLGNFAMAMWRAVP